MQARMRQVYLFAVVAVGLVVLGGTAVAQPGTSDLGMWKINLAKSKFDPGPPPKSYTFKIERVEGGMTKATVDIVSATGVATHNVWIGKYDGKPYPVQGGPPDQTRTYTRIDDRTVDISNSAGGTVTNTARYVLSRDGKTYTANGTGTVTGGGQNLQGVRVFDRQ